MRKIKQISALVVSAVLVAGMLGISTNVDAFAIKNTKPIIIALEESPASFLSASCNVTTSEGTVTVDAKTSKLVKTSVPKGDSTVDIECTVSFTDGEFFGSCDSLLETVPLNSKGVTIIITDWDQCIL